jgi:hypothetical protein
VIVFGRKISWPVAAAAAVLVVAVQLPELGQPNWDISLGLLGPLVVGWVGGRKVVRRVPGPFEPANFT